jgi:hypothetical protein
LYCARGEAENRIKEAQLDLFGTRASATGSQCRHNPEIGVMHIAALPGGLGQQFRGGPRVVADDELHATEPALLETTDELLTAAGAPRLASSTASTWRRPSSVLFELIAERYEHKSLAITANTPFSQWGELFVEPAMTLGAVDGLVHHSTIV